MAIPSFLPGLLFALTLLAPGLATAQSPRQKVGEKYLPEGQFVWHEIVSRDPAASERFYTNALDWKAVRAPVASPQEKPYVMFMGADGQMFAGIGATVGDESARWTCWVQVADVDQTARRVVGAGGLVVRPPREHLVGRVTEIADPGQGRLCLVQLHIRQPYVNLPPVVWHHGQNLGGEYVDDFYRDIVGWSAEPVTDNLRAFVVASHRVGSLESVRPGTAGTRGWLPVFTVDDLKRSVARAAASGARVTDKADTRPELGLSARLADPQGAEFWLRQR